METTWTKEKFDAASFDELVRYAAENWDDFLTHEELICCLESKVRSGELYVARHIINALIKDGPYGFYSNEAEYYVYDSTMGLLEPVCTIRNKEDLLDYFEEREFDMDDWYK